VSANSQTLHEISVADRKLTYRATAGTLPLRDPLGHEIASMFYVAYTLEGAQSGAARPVTFFFNGGPGSSTLFLHMGSFGPVRVPIGDPDSAGARPARWVANSQTLLDKTDLVFLDAVGTGFSTAHDPSNNRLFWGNDQDADSFVQAITGYLQANGRWDAPKYLFGESYGTMRAAIVAERLQRKGIDLRGLILLSSILNFGHLAPGLDQSAIDLLPSYAATAWYWHRGGHTGESLDELVTTAREYAAGPYALALAKGNRLSDGERHEVADRLSEFTGLTAGDLERTHLQIGMDRFRRLLLRDRHLSVGAEDTRFTGVEADDARESPSFDATQTETTSVYLSALNRYLATELHYASDREYLPGDQGNIMSHWDWAHQPPQAPRQNSLADVLPDLTVALERNRGLRVLSLNGYFDLMTPFFGTEFDLAKLPAQLDVKHRVTLEFYPSGHMIYVSEPALEALHRDIARFYDGASSTPVRH
jgi:carboxypeptidase C (cathepsin A)